MSSDDVSVPVPVAESPHFASSYDKAERAEPVFLPSAHLGPTMSNKTCVEGSSLKNSLQGGRSRSFVRWICRLLIPFQKIHSRYRLYKQEQEENEARLRVLYANLKNSKDIPVKDYPQGWPQLAALLYRNDNLAVFRRFGLTHCRVLLHLQAEIQLLEQRLSDLDHADSMPGSPNAWRLRTADFKGHWDPGQRDILKQLQEKLLVYDPLLFYEKSLRDVGQPPKADHLSVFHWIMANKPVGRGQYDWIFQADDFIQVSEIDRFQSSILSSFLKTLFRINGSRDGTPGQVVRQYSVSSVSAIAKLVNVLLAVAILIIPVFLLLWIPMTRPWISATVLTSVLAFSTLMSLLTKAKVQEVLVGTAAYCAVLAAFLGNVQANMSGKSC